MADPVPVSDDFNVRILQPLANFVLEKHGSAALQAVASEAGLDAGAFDGQSRWISLAQTERFLEHARGLFASDEAFRDACAYDYRNRSYGWMLLMGRAITPWACYVAGGKFINSSVAHFGQFDRYERVGSRCTIRYVSRGAESHRLCAVRLSQIAAVPTLYGLPPVHVDHPKCIARGDPCCEYVFLLVEPVRWLPAAVGLASGAAVLLLAHTAAGMPPSFLASLLPIVGLLAGLGFEWRRASVANRRAVLQSHESMLALAKEDAEARRELLAFEQRQHGWARVMEEQVAERLSQNQRVVEEIRLLEKHRIELTQSFSHDVNNSLTVLRSSTELLLDAEPGTENRSLLQSMMDTSNRMSVLLQQLMKSMSAEASELTLHPRTHHVSELVERLRRRIAALCHHRDIRTSVFATREAPEVIEIDEVLLDRVIDNLLSNAAKYTERGSIVVELGGVPGFLTLKVSDTGRGIAPEMLSRVFLPEGSEAGQRARDSFGLGLSVVVQLLGRIGGKLEVMSKPAKGTTFWVHLPEKTPAPPQEVLQAGQPTALNKVVMIRRSPV